jgi:hypothetical protein
MIRISACQGIILKSSNSVSEESALTSKILIPSFKANIIQYPGNLSNLAEFNASIFIEIKEKRNDWEKTGRQQQDFIQSQRVEMNQDDAMISAPWHISNTSFIQNLDIADSEFDIPEKESPFEEKTPEFDVSFHNSDSKLDSSMNYKHDKTMVSDDGDTSDILNEFYDVEDYNCIPSLKQFVLDERCIYSDPNVVFFCGSAKNAYSILKPVNFLDFADDSQVKIAFHTTFLENKEEEDQGLGIRKTFTFASGDLKDLLNAEISDEILISIDPCSSLSFSLLSLSILECMLSNYFSLDFFLEETLDDVQQCAFEIFKLPDRRSQKVVVSSNFSLFIPNLAVEIDQSKLFDEVLEFHKLEFSFEGLALSKTSSGSFDQKNIWKLEDCQSTLNLALERLSLSISKKLANIKLFSLSIEQIRVQILTELFRLGRSCDSWKINIATIDTEHFPFSVLLLHYFYSELTEKFFHLFELVESQEKTVALWWISILEEAIHNGCIAERSFKNHAQFLFIWELYHGALESSFQTVASKDFSRANLEQLENFPRYDDSFNNYCYLDSAPFGLLLRKLASSSTIRRKLLNPLKSGSSVLKLTLPSHDVMFLNDFIIYFCRLFSESLLQSLNVPNLSIRPKLLLRF